MKVGLFAFTMYMHSKYQSVGKVAPKCQARKLHARPTANPDHQRRQLDITTQQAMSHSLTPCIQYARRRRFIGHSSLIISDMCKYTQTNRRNHDRRRVTTKSASVCYKNGTFYKETDTPIDRDISIFDFEARLGFSIKRSQLIPNPLTPTVAKWVRL